MPSTSPRTSQDARRTVTASPNTTTAVVAGLHLERLPSVVAIPLHEYATAQHPMLRLWAMCDTVELLLRLLVAVGVGDSLRSRGDLPPRLRAVLTRHIDRPTLGGWWTMARAVAEHTPTRGAVVVEVTAFVIDALGPLLEGMETPRTVESSLMELRNRLAHGGSMGHAMAQMLAAAHTVRFEDALRVGSWIEDLDLVAPRARDGAGALRGPTVTLTRPPFIGQETIDLAIDHAPSDDAVILVRGNHAFSLWPLVSYGVPGRLDPTAPPFRIPVPQMYVRYDTGRLVQTPLASVEAAASMRTDAARTEYLRLFSRVGTPAEMPSLDSRVGQDAAAFRGRASELAALAAAAASTTAGVLWVSGAAGIGKTYLVARLASDLSAGDGDHQRTIFHSFAKSAGAYTRGDFLRSACAHLRSWLGRPLRGGGRAAPERDAQVEFDALLDEVGARRLTLVIDGLDELVQTDPTFVRDIALGTRRPNVLWVCAGRPARGLHEAFVSAGAIDVFPGGIPTMSKDDIREILLEGLGTARKQVLALDLDVEGGLENTFIDQVAAKADGLPLYVHYLLTDILSGKRTLAIDAGSLPEGLAGYYAQAFERTTVGSVHQALTPIACTLAVVKEPLTTAELHGLLAARRIVTPGGKGQRTTVDALALLGPMIRTNLTAGHERVSLYHETLVDYLAGSDHTGDAFATARAAFADAAEAWPRGYDQLAPYLFRHGIFHLLEDRRIASAVSLLCDFSYVHRRTAIQPAREAMALSDQYSAVLAHHDADTGGFSAWAHFIRSKAHLLTRGTAQWPAERILLQLALEHSESGPIAKAATEWLQRQEPDPGLILRMVRRPSSIGSQPSYRTLTGDCSKVVCTSAHRNAFWSIQSGELKLWDIATLRNVRTLRCRRPVHSIAELDDGKRILTAGYDGLELWDLEREARIADARLSARHPGFDEVQRDDFTLLSDERILAWQNRMMGVTFTLLSGRDLTVLATVDATYWSDEDWDYPRVSGVLQISATHVAMWRYRSSGSATTPQVDSVQLDNVVLTTLEETATGVINLDDDRAAVWHEHVKATMWDRHKLQRLTALHGPHDWDGSREDKPPLLVEAGRIVTWKDKSVHVCDTVTGTLLNRFEVHADGVWGAALHHDNLITWSRQGNLRCWNINTGQPLGECWQFKTTSPLSIGVAYLAHDLAVVYRRNRGARELALWNPTESSPRMEINLPDDTVEGVVGTGHSTFLTWGESGALRAWDARVRTEVAEPIAGAEIDGILPLAGVGGFVRGLITWTGSKVAVHDSSGTVIRTLEGHASRISNAKLVSPHWLATWAGEEESMRLWNLGDGSCETIDTGASTPLGALAGERLLMWREPKSPEMDDFQIRKFLRKRSMGVVEDDDHWLRVVDAHTGKPLDGLTLRLQAACRPELAFETSTGWLVLQVYCAQDRRDSHAFVIAWKPHSKSGCQWLRHSTKVLTVVDAGDGAIVTTTADGYQHLWGLERGKCVMSQRSYGRGNSSVSHTVLTRGDVTRVLFRHAGSVWITEYTRDGAHILAAWHSELDVRTAFASREGHVLITHKVGGEGRLHALALYQGAQRMALE